MKNKAATPTSAEISRRLLIVSELRNLCLSLGRAKRKEAVANALENGGVVQPSK